MNEETREMNVEIKHFFEKEILIMLNNTAYKV